jgi:ketosteroid isomerase-like protein
MKQLNIMFNLFCIVGLTLLLNGFQSLNAQKKSDNDMVMSVNQSFYTAFKDEDLNKMDQVWSHSPFVSAIHPISKDVIIGWKGVRESFEGVFKNYTNINIMSVNPKTHIEGNVAWVLCNEEFEAEQGTKKVKLTSAAINMFVKKSGKWLMVHHQATVPIPM